MNRVPSRPAPWPAEAGVTGTERPFVELETKELETAYFKTRVLPKVQYDSILRLITIFAQHLSSLSNQLMVQQATAEAPPVTKAPGTLPSVARNTPPTANAKMNRMGAYC